MNLLKEVFKPKSKGDIITVAVIFIVLGGFVVFEVAAFTSIMSNPTRVDVWLPTSKIPAEWVLTLGNSEIFSTPAELTGDTVFMISLRNLETQHVNIELDFVNCIINKIVLATGRLDSLYSANRYFISSSEVLELENNVAELDLGAMNYPNSYDVLFIRVTDMGNSGVKLLHRVSLID